MPTRLRNLGKSKFKTQAINPVIGISISMGILITKRGLTMPPTYIFTKALVGN